MRLSPRPWGNNLYWVGTFTGGNVAKRFGDDARTVRVAAARKRSTTQHR
jgi:hypothetical protein